MANKTNVDVVVEKFRSFFIIFFLYSVFPSAETEQVNCTHLSDHSNTVCSSSADVLLKAFSF